MTVQNRYLSQMGGTVHRYLAVFKQATTGVTQKGTPLSITDSAWEIAARKINTEFSVAAAVQADDMLIVRLDVVTEDEGCHAAF